MSRRQLVVLGLLAATLIAAVLAWSRFQQPLEIEPQSLIFPDLAQRQERIDSIRVSGAGNASLVTLQKTTGVWRVRERDGWPADAGKISETLFLLAQARLLEQKTANPAQYSKIGVEPLSGRWAQGEGVLVEGGGKPLRLLIGHAHVNFDGDYIRVNDGAQSWLSDRRLDISRDPVEWLDRHLIDLPLARVAQVKVEATDGDKYSLSPRDDRFRLDGLPSGAMGDSHAGDAMAGLLEQLDFDDVGNDDGRIPTERRVDFLGVDGTSIHIDEWRDHGKVWVRLNAALDQARAERWLTETGRSEPRRRDAVFNKLRGQIAAWQAKFAGKRFLLPNFKAAILMMNRSQVLKGAE